MKPIRLFGWPVDMALLTAEERDLFSRVKTSHAVGGLVRIRVAKAGTVVRFHRR